MAQHSETTAFSELNGRQKLQYIWDYYKLPIFGICILLYVIGYLIHGQLTKKEQVLYVAAVNVTVNDYALSRLTDEFLTEASYNPKKNEIYLYQNLLLANDTSVDPQYAAASQVKILAAIDGQQLDVVLASKDVIDAFEDEGFLAEQFDLSDTTFFKQAGYTEPVYLGILSNTPRLETAKLYQQYLAS